METAGTGGPESPAFGQRRSPGETIGDSEIWSVVRRLPSYTRLLVALWRHPGVPRRYKLALGLALGYSVSPVDLVPGFIPVVGQLDDLFVVLRTAEGLLRRLPDRVTGPLLHEAGLSLDQVRQDRRTVQRAMGRIAWRAANLVVKGAWEAGKWGSRLAWWGLRGLGSAAGFGKPKRRRPQGKN